MYNKYVNRVDILVKTNSLLNIYNFLALVNFDNFFSNRFLQFSKQIFRFKSRSLIYVRVLDRQRITLLGSLLIVRSVNFLNKYFPFDRDVPCIILNSDSSILVACNKLSFGWRRFPLDLNKCMLKMKN